jgi:uncharacterized membrane protein
MSFLNPLFLIGLAAVALPIIVHLVRRTRARRVEFASLMFVRQIPQRTIRRKRLHNLLLLALRSLAFLLLVLAFARPYFKNSAAAEMGGRNRASVVLLDTSFSTRYQNRFEQIKARARAIVNEASSDEKLALATFGQSFEVQSRFTDDKAKILALIDAAQAGLTATSYAQALQGAEELMKEAGAPERRVVLVSDFQASGWNPADTAFKLSKDIKLVTIDVSDGATANLAVTEVSAQPVIYQQKYADKLAARVHNFGDEEKSGVRVEFLLNDHTVEKREVKIPARESVLVEFADFNLSEGANRALITVSGDDFTLDNNFYLALRREAQGQALVIENAGRGESLYLRSALTTGENLPFALTVKTAGSVNPADLASYKVIVLNDAQGVSAALANALQQFVERGGGLIIAAGRNTEPGTINDALKAVAPATLGDAVQLGGDYASLSEIKTDHPVFDVFRESGRLAAARVFGYRRAMPHEKSAVLARYEDGSPALIESSFGSGKVLMFTSTLDSSWNDLPLTPIYLPLVRQMVRYLGERDARAWHLVGQTFTAAPAKDGSLPAVDAPSGGRLTERNQTSAGELIVNAREPGFYKLRYSQAADFAAVDLEGRESDFTKLNVEEFVAAVTGADKQSAQANAAQAKLTEAETEAQQRVWWPLLIAALALFVAEAILARRTKMARVIG